MTVTQSDSDTSLILETHLSITSATTFMDMTITTDAAHPDLEPCLIYNSCNFCENDNCFPHIDNYLKNGTRLQPINRYSSSLVYECGLARGFVVPGSNITILDVRMDCKWDPKWETTSPTSSVPECDCESIVLQHLFKVTNKCPSVQGLLALNRQSRQITQILRGLM